MKSRNWCSDGGIFKIEENSQKSIKKSEQPAFIQRANQNINSVLRLF